MLSGISQYNFNANNSHSSQTENSALNINTDTSNKDEAPEKNQLSTEPVHYDFTNMSRREFTQLVKNNEYTGGLPPIILPEAGIDMSRSMQEQMDAVYDEKINFIQFLTDSKAFNRSIGQSTEYYDNILSKINQLQGKEKPPQLNEIA